MQDYLTNMGIERWTLRSAIPSTLPAGYAYELWHQQQRIGILFAAAAHEDAAIEQLLTKMIVAIRCQPQGGWYSQQPDYRDLEDLRFIITLGDDFEVRENVQHIHSYSPAQLLAQPSLKAETWKSLQAVFTLLP